MQWWVVVAVVAAAVRSVEGARVLMLAPVGSTSHKNFFMSIADVLAERNHTVTFVTGSEVFKPRRNIREIFVPNSAFSKYISNQSLFNVSAKSLTMSFMSLIPKACADALSSKEVQEIREEEYDLVFLSIFSAECFYPYISSLKVPYIHMSPLALSGSYSDMANNPFFPSMVSNLILDLDYPLTFAGRLINTLADVAYKSLSVDIVYPRIEEECLRRNLWPENYPSLKEMRINGSLLIVNSVKTLEMPAVPYVPAVVHAGGLHCRPAQALSQDLEEWAAGAGDAGFIFFSLGSIVKPSLMPEEYRVLLLKVFASLEQRVLWKWDHDSMDGLPPNVRLNKWLPQQDILGDPRLRLFVTHGGMLSTMEATYHGVPVLGLPLFGDQYHNMGNIQRGGWGRFLLWEDLTHDNLRQAILDLIHDTKAREEVKRRSVLMRDEPMPIRDWVAFWVEYVLRHHGAYHIRCPAATMPWYELYNVDVWLLVLVLVALSTYLSFRLLLALCSCLCFRRKRKQD